jgi:hypothetical protein
VVQLNKVFILKLQLKEKCYFNNEENNTIDCNCLFEAIRKCIDDYHGEVKHFRNNIKMVTFFLFEFILILFYLKINIYYY